MFAHLHVHSPFSFLDGASSLEELLEQAAAINCHALAITDHNNMGSAVRFAKLAPNYGIIPIHGCEITLTNGHHLTLLCQNRIGYANLCRLLTHSHLNSPRGLPAFPRAQLAEYSEGLIALSGCRRGEIPSLILHGLKEEALASARYYAATFPGCFYIELQNNLLPRTTLLNNTLADLAEHLHLPLVATANAHYATPNKFPIHDVLTCVRTLTTLASIHPCRRLNAENYLFSRQAMQSRFRAWPSAWQGMQEIAERCSTALPLGENLFPTFTTLDGSNAPTFLRQLVYQGAQKRYGWLSSHIKERLDHELSIICKLGVADYFLVAWDIARYARLQGIRYAGRGSAADSAVAYCLYITDVDAIDRQLLFERFLNLERAKKPDIDIDFDATRRADVAQYVYDKYGKEHVASVCTYHTYHARSALRDFGKAMGFTIEEIDRLTKLLPHLAADSIRKAITALPELANSDLPFSRYNRLIDLCEQVAGFPRHIGTHLGGLVISHQPIIQISPLQMAAKGVAIIQFDKNDIEDLGLIKLDLLSLRTLSAVQTAMQDINANQQASNLPPLEYSNIPANDPATYDMLKQGETIGVFQLESPAQRALQTRLAPQNSEDILASIALIRPGPIKGNMVEPFIARRHGQEPVEYLHPDLEPILAKTYGVVLFQEQVIEIATKLANFSPGEADRLRKAMSQWHSQKQMEAISKEFITRAVENGIPRQTAEVIYSYIASYAGFGFCEAHAAAFSDTAYKTAYLVKHYPAQFYAAILSHQPMGYYPARTICLEATRRGIQILPPDINRSHLRYTVEENAIRVSLAQVRTMTTNLATEIMQQRTAQEFLSLKDFCQRVVAPRHTITNLILGGAFDNLHANRRHLLWQLDTVIHLRHHTRQPLPLSDVTCKKEEQSDFTVIQKYQQEVSVLGFSPGKHFMQFSRAALAKRGALPTAIANKAKQGASVTVAGLVLRLHRPPTRSGRTVVFFSLEDEQGLSDVTVFEDVYHKYGSLIYTSTALLVQGYLERRGEGASIIAQRIYAWSIDID